MRERQEKGGLRHEGHERHEGRSTSPAETYQSVQEGRRWRVECLSVGAQVMLKWCRVQQQRSHERDERRRKGEVSSSGS